MQQTIRATTLGAALVVWVGALAACSVDTASNTGIRINVRLDDSLTVEDPSGLIDTLRFYVAVKHPEHEDVWVLNDAAAGIVVDVTGRNLEADPYQLLIGDNGDGEMETIRVVVVGERDGAPVVLGQLQDPSYQQFQAGRIVQRTVWLRPAGQDFTLTWTVTGCLMSSHRPEAGEEAIRFGTGEDLDCDGYLAGDDCNDLDPNINPGVVENFDCDGVDNDCDGIIDPGGNVDNDEDGFTACDGDCDDQDPDTYPGAEELCDTKDNNCNGKCDEIFDNDGDGYTPCNSYLDHSTDTCVWVPTPDCDDENEWVHPGAEEECNGRDDNCNLLCDEGFDPDGDGYTWCGSKSGQLIDPVPGEDECLEPNPEYEDCDPDDPTVYPGAPELCDNVLNDCNGSFSTDTTTCYVTSGDTVCLSGLTTCTESDGGTERWSECVVDGSAHVPLAYCGVWPGCADTPDPYSCMQQAIQQQQSLSCNLHFFQGYFEPCGGPQERPIYYLPFGFSGNANCHWHILFDSNNTADWTEVGLIPPNNPLAPAGVVVNGCEAALVAVPSANGEAPAGVSGTISFYYDNTDNGGDYFGMEMPFTIEPVNTCPADYESLVCTI